MTAQSGGHVLPALLEEVRSALGDELVGVYLYGSAVVGDFDEGVSDIDLVAAVADELDQEALDGLDTAHRRIWSAHPDFLDRIDIVYAPVAILSGRPGAAGRVSLLVTVSPGSPLHSTSVTQEWVLTCSSCGRRE
ncbi:nucleotidyltransferase domain-containing protein [Streptomyces azureus]|uniref:Putative Streptomycin 3''-adenylyltransferase n=1 Tax=Streptomyces azureus TaxID=146537 RepID=A0A0K8PLX1_STRAJ|nr:nucleotidyltransferase domain-containing protein [Streptomyces azureus]GAP48758.1 putative Streptomycin 3''-adenylyltransferase [Streptomyces azureus]